MVICTCNCTIFQLNDIITDLTFPDKKNLKNTTANQYIIKEPVTYRFTCTKVSNRLKEIKSRLQTSNEGDTSI